MRSLEVIQTIIYIDSIINEETNKAMFSYSLMNSQMKKKK